jgi:hypothetical protein
MIRTSTQKTEKDIRVRDIEAGECGELSEEPSPLNAGHE